MVTLCACDSNVRVKQDALGRDGSSGNDADDAIDSDARKDGFNPDSGKPQLDTAVDRLPKIDVSLPQDSAWWVQDTNDQCHVKITPISPSSLLGLTPGPNQTLQVRGDIILGSQAPFNPLWNWQVIRSDGVVITPTLIEQDPSIVHFPISIPARYDILVSIGNGCSGSTHALAPNPQSQFTMYRIRVLPPGTLASTTSDSPMAGQCKNKQGGKCPVPYETDLRIEAGSTQITRDVALEIGVPVTIDPYNPAALPLPIAVPSYIRIMSPLSTWVVHGHSSNQGPFYTLLDGLISYQVLVVPDAYAFGITLPPYLIQNLNPNDTQVTAEYIATVANPLSLEQGITITGRITANNLPVEGASINLQSEVLFSTGGVADDQGIYSLRVNPGGVFAVHVAPPEGSPLPTATISQGIVLSDTETSVPPIDFDWTPGETTDLHLSLKWMQEPAVLPPITVYLESEPTSLKDVGTLTVTGVFPATLVGKIKRSATTTAPAQVTFSTLPRAKYKVTAIPSSAVGDVAMTTAIIDLTQSAERSNVSLLLKRKVWVSGRLRALPPLTEEAAIGTVILANDLGSGFFAPTISTTLTNTGEYALLTDPARTYQLRAQPPAEKGFPENVLLTGFYSGEFGTQIDDQLLPRGVAVQGTVTFASSTIEGAIVQVFCVGQLPDCIESTDRSRGAPPVLAQAVTDTEGNYRLWLADPKITQ
jgi:hypothetical protein